MNATPNDSIGPLSGEHIMQLMQSREKTAPILKAAKFAGYNGRMMVLGAIMLAPFAISQSDTPGMVLAGLLAVLGFRELKLRKPLHQLSPSALTGLVTNQVLVAMAVTAYAVWYLINPGHPQMISQAQALTTESVPEFLRPYESYLMYVAMIAGAMVFQGFAMFFYMSKKKPLASFASECPPWIVDLYRRGVMG